MSVTLEWLGHASFRICHDETIIYIDPWKIKGSPKDASVVLVSHSHYDHYSPDDIAKVNNPNTKLVTSSDVVAEGNTGQALSPGSAVEMQDFIVWGIASYNPDKQFHPKANNWLGFVIEFESKRIYYAGDTDLTDEMKTLTSIDVALLPVGGTYTMDVKQAAQATKHIQPELAVPYHWGDIVGDIKDAKQFAELAYCKVKVLEPGQTISIE